MNQYPSTDLKPSLEKSDQKLNMSSPSEDGLRETFFIETEHKDHQHLHNLKPVTKTIKKESHLKRGYTFTSDEVRQQLIEAVHTNGERINCAAKRLGIKYSSAKAICQVYKREGRSNKKIPRRHVFMSSTDDSDSDATEKEKFEISNSQADDIKPPKEEFLETSESDVNSQLATQITYEFKTKPSSLQLQDIFQNSYLHLSRSTDQSTHFSHLESVPAKSTKITPIYITNPLGQALPSQYLQASDPSLGYFKPEIDPLSHINSQIEQNLLMRSQPQRTYRYTPAINTMSSHFNASPHALKTVYFLPIFTKEMNSPSTSSLIPRDCLNEHGQFSGHLKSSLDQTFTLMDPAVARDALFFRKSFL